MHPGIIGMGMGMQGKPGGKGKQPIGGGKVMGCIALIGLQGVLLPPWNVL